MIDRYAPGQAVSQPLAAPALPEGAEPNPPELNPLHFNRDERLAAERSAA
jgi:hypothetical protein